MEIIETNVLVEHRDEIKAWIMAHKYTHPGFDDMVRIHRELSDAIYNRENKAKTVYVSGKVTGLDREETLHKFDSATRKLDALCFSFINPMREVPAVTTWVNAMKICIPLVKRSDAVLLLHDWADSTGAKMEKICADACGIPVFESIEKLYCHFNVKIWKH